MYIYIYSYKSDKHFHLLIYFGVLENVLKLCKDSNYLLLYKCIYDTYVPGQNRKYE